MNIMKNAVFIILALVLSAGLANMNKLYASETKSDDQVLMPPVKAGELYLPSDDSMADVTAVLEAARKSNKLALVILGANWCHDSRGLASRLQQEPLSTVVNEFYETIFVDVGYLEKGKDVINSLGPPVYYATPTVLIVDPVSGELVNARNRHQWADAYNIRLDYPEYPAFSWENKGP